MRLNITTLIPVVAYLLGSIPFGLLIVKAFGGAGHSQRRQRKYRRRQRDAQRRSRRRRAHAACSTPEKATSPSGSPGIGLAGTSAG